MSAATPVGATPADPDRAGRSDPFDLTEIGPGRFTAGSVGDPAAYQVVYGGQLLAQMILASDRVAADKGVASIHTLFARGATPTQPIEIDVDVIHDGATP